MGLITSEAEFISYIKRMLGNPVINVEVADANVSDCIYDAVQEFQRYNQGEGTYRDALAISLSAGVSAYQLPDNIDSIVDIKLSQNNMGINELFSIPHQLLYQQFQMGNFMGGNAYGGVANLGGYGVLADFQIQMTYLSEIQEMFERRYVCDLNPNTFKMTIKPTPMIDSAGVLFVFKKEDAINLYNNPLVKKLAIAKVKKIWGRTLEKYQSINLPGGSSMNGAAIKQEGIEEEKEILEEIRLQSNPLVFLVA